MAIAIICRALEGGARSWRTIDPGFGAHDRVAIAVFADAVGAPHRIYHDAFGAIPDAEADARDTVIGYITNLPSICEPQPPREVLAITPIEFLVMVPKFPKLVRHQSPTRHIDVVSAVADQFYHVRARAEQFSRLNSTRGRHEPGRSLVQSRTDANRACLRCIEQIASWVHDVRLHVILSRFSRVMPLHLPCGEVAEEINAPRAFIWSIVLPHAEHFLCNYGEGCSQC